MDKNAIWKYYGEVAKELGESPVKEKDENGNLVIKKDEEGHVVFKRENYSLQFFYENKLEHLASKSPLLHTFLGYENAIDARQWNCDILLENEISQWLSSDKKPYKSQIEAIRYAVSRPITMIQGPPGTGKTEMILNLLSTIHGKFPDKTVAVVSANNEAINNITAKIKEDKSFSDISEVYAQWGNNGILYQWQKEHKEYEEYFYQKKRDKGNPVCRFDPRLLTKIPLFSCTIHSLRKIFINEELFKQDIFEGDELFDYVIVDECSQVSTLLGLLTMGSAKEHLVLIGDNEQLAPVVEEKRLAEIEKRYSMEDVPDEYRVTEDNTFLKVCEKIYSDKAQNVMLNEHYRCHPAIIGFCNECVYDGKLVVKTMNDGRFPIRILWYEGEYSEYIYKKKEEEDKVKRTLQNMRQIEIFLQEEWTLLCNRMEDDINTSICVISPYRGQLEILEKLLKRKIEYENNDKIKDLISSDLEIEDGKEGIEEKIPCLTIHKSQGKGFDIVCFLSVCDYDNSLNEPWAQQRRMINVAVSRAKKEFHLIVSNQWLPENFQKKEIGYVLPHAEKTDDYYLIKLIDYTYRNLQNRNLRDGDFGFHRSAITSLFDRVPLYRKSTEKDLEVQKREAQTASAPEKCMREFLLKNFSGEYKIYREIPLGEIYPSDECQDSELKEYIENGSRIDFLICKDKEALLTIEVDGEQHRKGGNETERHDELKNSCFELLKNEIAFLRINTDGSGRWIGTYDRDGINILSKEGEVQKMQDYIAKATELPEHREFTNENGNASECTEASAEDLLNYYKFFVKECMNGLKDYLSNSKNPFPSLGYTGVEKNDYSDQATDYLYFCKYGIAYAFEYAMLYEIMLSIHDGNDFGVYSFGCGGFIDAWALAYARAKLREEELHKNLSLFYQGVDIVPWKTKVFGDIIDKTWPGNGSNDTVKYLENEKLPIIYENTNGDIKCDISDYKFRKPKICGIDKFDLKEMENKMFYNVLIFPRILNELEDEDLNGFIKKLAEIKPIKGWTYYLCVSHSISDMDKEDSKGVKAVEEIVKMLEDKKMFNCIEADLQVMLKDKYEGLRKKYNIELDNKNNSAYKCYYIPRVKIETLGDKVFKCEDVCAYLDELAETKGEPCRQMCNSYIKFQIIKFT